MCITSYSICDKDKQNVQNWPSCVHYLKSNLELDGYVIVIFLEFSTLQVKDLKTANVAEYFTSIISICYDIKIVFIELFSDQKL